jgi:hypothetical protein
MQPKQGLKQYNDNTKTPTTSQTPTHLLDAAIDRQAENTEKMQHFCCPTQPVISCLVVILLNEFQPDSFKIFNAIVSKQRLPNIKLLCSSSLVRIDQLMIQKALLNYLQA